MKVDLAKNGLESVFTPWQITALNILTEDKTHTSFTLTETLNKRLTNGGVSRASVIGFMKQLEARGIVEVEKGVGRGGEYRIYKTWYTLDGILNFIVELAENWVETAKLSMKELKQ